MRFWGEGGIFISVDDGRSSYGRQTGGAAATGQHICQRFCQARRRIFENRERVDVEKTGKNLKKNNAIAFLGAVSSPSARGHMQAGPYKAQPGAREEAPRGGLLTGPRGEAIYKL